VKNSSLLDNQSLVIGKPYLLIVLYMLLISIGEKKIRIKTNPCLRMFRNGQF